MPTNHPTAADELVEHFPTGLRSTRHVLAATREVFESPIRCDCYCGAEFTGTDEQEVRQLWAEHALSIAQPILFEQGRLAGREEAAKIIEKRNRNEGGREDAAAIRQGGQGNHAD